MSQSEYAGTGQASVEQWMAQLGESRGDPGGGAAAGIMLSIAAALTTMIAGYSTVGPELEAEHDALLERAAALRATALRLADDDAAASREFGAAFRLPSGAERDAAIRHGSVDGARSSAALGDLAAGSVDDLPWLSRNGNPALVADLAVACGALRAALTAARTNLSFDLATLTSTGESLEQVRLEHPSLWGTVAHFDEAIARIDALTTDIDAHAAPTD